MRRRKETEESRLTLMFLALATGQIRWWWWWGRAGLTHLKLEILEGE